MHTHGINVQYIYLLILYMGYQNNQLRLERYPFQVHFLCMHLIFVDKHTLRILQIPSLIPYNMQKLFADPQPAIIVVFVFAQVRHLLDAGVDKHKADTEGADLLGLNHPNDLSQQKKPWLSMCACVVLREAVLYDKEQDLNSQPYEKL